jgi:hypothetical protein
MRGSSESDVSPDRHVARSRDTGGKSEEFVGRVAGEDTGYSDETGAERRRPREEGEEPGEQEV